MIRISRDHPIRLQTGRQYPRELLRGAFREMRAACRAQPDVPRLGDVAVDAGEPLFTLAYEQNRIQQHGFQAVTAAGYWSYDFLQTPLDRLDLTLLRRYRVFVFCELEEYTLAILELLLRMRGIQLGGTDVRLYCTDPLVRAFFAPGEVQFVEQENLMAGAAGISWDNPDVCLIRSVAEFYNPPFADGALYNSFQVMESLLWTAQRRHYGERNRGTTILLLRYPTMTAGLFDIMKFTYAFVRVAWQRGWIPVVCLDQEPNQYLAERTGAGHENMWESFFPPASRIPVAEVFESDDVIVVDGLFPQTSGRANPYQMEAFFRFASALDAKDLHEARSILRPNFATESVIEALLPAPLQRGDPVLGVISRGTDYRAEAAAARGEQPANAAADDMIAAVRAFLAQHDVRYIFLATEDEAYFQKFCTAFREKLLFIRQQRVRYDESKRDRLLAELLPVEDGRSFGRRYLAILFALGRCRWLLSSMNCGAMQGAWLYSAYGFETFRIVPPHEAS